MRFIHAADIHLDSPLRGLAAYQDAPVELLRNATRDAFSRLVNEAIELAVDFVVIAGDLYDGAWRDLNSGRLLFWDLVRFELEGMALILFYV